ncbi:AfsR/SARP family transcriptional regulator [Streptomyces sp. GD-15H]|uniref:AfsR/SARP family transcriptional regulator n=1 Tax=Streptomyces sp. GD-15H TaxID=3129112 RepID=UPI003243027D
MHEADPRTVAELLTQALDLWRGAALLDTGEGPVCRMAGTRLEETRLTAYERLFDARLRLGQHRAVIPDLEQLHAQYPLREHFCPGPLLPRCHRVLVLASVHDHRRPVPIGPSQHRARRAATDFPRSRPNSPGTVPRGDAGRAVGGPGRPSDGGGRKACEGPGLGTRSSGAVMVLSGTRTRRPSDHPGKGRT